MDEYVARLCWNSAGWTGPTREAEDLETGTYVTRTGVGHEEWLFDPESEIDGWRYGFLQPVSKPRDRLADSLIDVRLFTIGPKSRWLYVGRLPECHVLSKSDAAAAKAIYRKSGRLKQMQRLLKDIGADPESVDYSDPRWLVNVRYRPETAVRYIPPIEIPANHLIRKRVRRYELVAIRGDLERVRDQWPDGGERLTGDGYVAADEVPTVGTYTEGAVRIVSVNAYERDPRARAECIARHGRACCVCGMTFEARYGSAFSSIVHVHHLRPLASLRGPRGVDPERDLRPVCPNCHAALHRKDPPYTPEQLKALLQD